MARRYVAPAHGTKTPDQAGFEAWCGEIEAALAVLGELGAAYAPRAGDDPSDMTVAVAAGRRRYGLGLATGTGGGAPETTLATDAEQVTPAFVAPVSDGRIDRVYVHVLTGQVGVLAGAEAAAPVAPPYPDFALPVCAVTLGPGQTALTDAHLTDERGAAMPGAARASFTARGTYTLEPPPWARYFAAVVVGGGGHAGNAWTDGVTHRFGGGGGAAATEPIQGMACEPLTIVVGRGGWTGEAGTASSLTGTISGRTVTAAPGSPGTDATPGAAGTGGPGGTGSSSGYSGAPGANGISGAYPITYAVVGGGWPAGQGVVGANTALGDDTIPGCGGACWAHSTIFVESREGSDGCVVVWFW